MFRHRFMNSACTISIWGSKGGGGDNNGGGSGGNQTQQKPQNGQAGNNNNSNDNKENNTDPNKDMIDSIWEDVKTKDTKGGDGSQPPDNQRQQQQPQDNKSDPQKDVDAYLAGIGLGEFKLSDTELEAFKTGEGVQGVLDNINKRIRDGHIKAVSAANTLIEKKVAEAVDQAVNKSKSFYQGEQLRSLLQERLPWTKDPVIAPMAETVLRQLLTKGATYDQGIEGTKKYFERVQIAMDPTYVAPNKNTNQPYRGQQQQDKGNMDWIKTLQARSN